MLNYAVLLGRIVRDPELRQTQNGKSVCSFCVAVDGYARSDADKQVDFIDCVAWSGTAEFLVKYFHKGDPVAIEGRIQTRSYENDKGEKKRVTEIVCSHISFVPRAKAGATDTKTEEEADLYRTAVSTFGVENVEVVHDSDLPF